MSRDITECLEETSYNGTKLEKIHLVQRLKVESPPIGTVQGVATQVS